jgi:hypothetical protein
MVINGFTLSQRDYSKYHVVSVMPCIVREPALAKSHHAWHGGQRTIETGSVFRLSRRIPR